jgi:SAM-dependent methyltransferase
MASWDDNAAVEALSGVAGSVDRLAEIASARRGDLADSGSETSTELPLQNLPAHLQFARLWQKLRDTYLPRAETRPCPVCATVQNHQWFPTQDGYAYVVCETCGMVYIPSVLPLSVWDDYFAALPQARDWFAQQMASTLTVSAREHNQRRFDRYFDVLQSVGSLVDGARTLDIGTYNGAFLDVAAARGFSAFGIEGLQEAVRFVRETLPALRVTFGRAELFPADIHGGNFSLITMWETLEHTVSPSAALACVREALVPGGMLALTVPNASNVQFSVLREYCYYAYGGYEGIGHVNLYTPRTLQEQLERAGFELIHFETEFGTDWRQIVYYLQHRFKRIHCYENLVRDGDIERAPEGGLAIMLNWLSPALTRLENALLSGPILLTVARRR